jgi:hypothetical protein
VLLGRDCIILAGNDDTGREHAEAIAQSLSRKARSVRIITLPGLGMTGEVSDWLATGKMAMDFRALLREPSRPKPDANMADDLPLTLFGDIEPVLTSDDFVEGLLTSTSQAVLYGEPDRGSCEPPALCLINARRAKTRDDTGVTFSKSARRTAVR